MLNIDIVWMIKRNHIVDGSGPFDCLPQAHLAEVAFPSYRVQQIQGMYDLWRAISRPCYIKPSPFDSGWLAAICFPLGTSGRRTFDPSHRVIRGAILLEYCNIVRKRSLPILTPPNRTNW